MAGEAKEGRRISPAHGPEDYGKLVLAAHDLDESWMVEGRCYGWQTAFAHRRNRATPWQCSADDVIAGMRGEQWQNYARIICAGCPVQYDCARYAVRGLMCQGTWGMRITLLKRLQKMEEKQPGSGVALIDAAQEAHMPVQNILISVT